MTDPLNNLVKVNDMNALNYHDHNYSQQLNVSTNDTQTKVCVDSEWQVYSPKQMKRGNDVKNSNETGDSNPKKSKCDNMQNVLKLKNRFDVLKNTSEMETEEHNVSSNSSLKPDMMPVREPKVPPIFIPNVSNVKSMERSFEDIMTKEDYLYKCINPNTLKLLIKSSDVYRKVVHKLNEMKINFHTYQLKQDRAYRVVLKNMHFSTDLNEIKDSLQELGHNVRNITNARHFQTKQPLSMFYIDLEPSSNNRDIFSIQYLLNAKIVFEPPQKKKEIVQCKRCQQYGHTRTYCRHPFRCVKCGANHDSAACTKEPTTAPTCALCGEKHTASYKGCIVYKTLQKKEFPPLRKKTIEVTNDELNQTPVRTEPQNTKLHSNYADAVKYRSDKVDEVSLTQTIQDFFNKFEKMFLQQSQQIGSLLNLLTTLISKIN